MTILDFARTLDPANAGTTTAIEAIVPMDGFGPVGLAVTPDGRHALVSASEGDQLEDGGRTISVIDLASRKVLLIVSSFRSNGISIIDVKKALAGKLGAETARIRLETPSGGPSRPRGVVVTPDGRYAAITGAARGTPGSGELWVLDVPARKVVGRVTGVGNETYLLALLPARP